MSVVCLFVFYCNFTLGGKVTELVPPIVESLADDFMVTHAPAKAAFLVSRKDGPIYVVTLFPKESCSCPTVTTCCHIVATKRSIGLQSGERKPLNLCELRKRNR